MHHLFLLNLAWLSSLVTGNAIWLCRTNSTLVMVMTWHLAASSNDLNNVISRYMAILHNMCMTQIAWNVLEMRYSNCFFKEPVSETHRHEHVVTWASEWDQSVQMWQRGLMEPIDTYFWPQRPVSETRRHTCETTVANETHRDTFVATGPSGWDPSTRICGHR